MENFTTPGAIQSLTLSLPYSSDTLALYQRLEKTTDTLLLDSAEIDSRANLKSILLIQAALSLTCNGQTVTITALTSNGQQLLPWLIEQLEGCAQLEQTDEHTMQAQFSQPDASLDEDSRLRQASNIEPLRILQHALKRQHQHPLEVFLGGIFAYDYVASFEQLPHVELGENSCPDYQFYLAESLLIVDHQQQQSELIGSLFSGPDSAAIYPQLVSQLAATAARLQLPTAPAPQHTQAAATEVEVQPSATEFARHIQSLQEHILAGDIFQVVPSRRFRLPCSDTIAAYRRLKQTNPSPYMFLLRTAQFDCFGASPESALKYTASSNQVELYPIAGTRPRGKDNEGAIHPDLDSRLELELRLDQKELAEHMMLVDLARNDLARVAIPGTRYVADLLKVDRYSHVMHLVSRVVAQLQPELDALHAYRACMNMGTLVGAPKISAATLIREVEQVRRGSYGGAIGYLSGNGDMDTCIVIRSAFVQNGMATIQAGAGVVYDSVIEAEVKETENKAHAVIEAVRWAETNT